MAEPSYILFHKSLLQCRSLGARGGRAYGRNLRARRALLPTSRAINQDRLVETVGPQQNGAQ
jgi:hypothetical protein